MLIAQISDVHVGSSRYRSELLRRAVEEINAAEPELALVAVDSSKPDMDEGEVRREHYGWIEEGFTDEADLRVRGFPHPAYNLIDVREARISVQTCIPGGERHSLGEYPRDWPAELSARHSDPFVRRQRGLSLADERPSAGDACT